MSIFRFCFSLILSMCCSFFAFSQKKDYYVFLGDTLKVEDSYYDTLPSSDQQKLKKLANKQGFYVVSSVGQLQLNERNYTFLDPLHDGVTKVLVIGNSFSDDGVESYLYDMARSQGRALVIGNLFRGGAPLDFHLKNALGNIKIYSYRKTSIDGLKSNTDKTSILEALKDENWDYICFQQASATSGDWSTVEASLPALFSYVQDNYPVSSVKYLYHQTWAYSQNAVTKNFELYDKNQQLMYSKIVDVSKKVSDLIPVYKIVPSGTAIQNGRTSYLGDNFNREGYHLDLAHGRFTAASTWYETLFGGILEMDFKPAYLNKNAIDVAKHSAYFAVQHPFNITPLKDFSAQNSKYIPFEKIQINFGSDLLIPGWTSLLFEKKGSARHGLLAFNNKPTAVNVEVLQDFESRKSNGLNKTSFESAIPSPVTKTFFNAVLNQESSKEPFLEISNLNSKKKYKVIIISTLQENIDDIEFVVTGAKKEVRTNNPSYNRINEVVFDNVRPNSLGNIELGFQLGKDRTEGRAVINAMLIEELK